MIEHLSVPVFDLLFKLTCLAVGGAVALAGWFVLWLSREFTR